MKKIILLSLLAYIVGCCAQKQQKPPMVLKSDYIKLQDSVQILKAKIDSVEWQNIALSDSIEDLQIRPYMTAEQFIMIYKYLSLEKYYLLCERKPSNWKYYKGWSRQVFQQK